MAAARQYPVRLLLALVLMPALWWGLDAVGALGGLNNLAMQAQYRFRGEIPAFDGTRPDHPPLKIIYVDVDSPTIQLLGERPWDRDYYARIINAICKYGQPKAVGLDFILSSAGLKSQMVDRAKARAGNDSMADVMQVYNQVVLAAMYSDVLDTSVKGETKTIPFPYLYKGYTDPKKVGFPEAPTYPIISLGYGRIGLINVATDFNPYGVADSTPRWVPLFAETEGDQRVLALAAAMIDHHQLPEDSAVADDTSIILFNADKTQVLKTLTRMEHAQLFHMAVELSLSYLGLDHSNIRRTPEALQVVAKDGHTLLNIPLTKDQLVEINWFSKWDNPVLNPRVSAISVIQNGQHLGEGTPEDQAKAAKFFEQFKDAVVLIGPTDPVLQDIAPTPFDAEPKPKVSVYGNLLKTFFTGNYIRHSPAWLDLVLLCALTYLVGGLGIYTGHGSGWAKIAAFVLLGAYVICTLEAFARASLMLPLVAPVGSSVSMALVGAIARLADEEKQKKRITGMFGTYLAPEVVKEMVASGAEPQLGGHSVNITCFFSDVQDFSTFSEVLPPARLTSLMNDFLTPMSDIVQAERGSLDKYIGDAIVAMYGAPVEFSDHALRACVAACQMQKCLADLRKRWKGETEPWPERVHHMRMRIGLNTGEAIVGNMGSRKRFNYTMMGDTVNLGARCESGAKQYGVYTMCTEDTMKAATAAGDQVLFRRLNKIKVKGRTIPTAVYEVVGFRNEASADTLKCVALFEKGLELYFAQQWDMAHALFAEAEKLEPLQPGRDQGVHHNPSELMQKECAHMKANPPPADWDGVKTMTEK